MGNIKIKSATPNEKMLLDYLNKNASEDLANRINDGDKTLSQCWNYIVSEAKKHAKDGCACIEDKVVYGWAIHFFEEDSIKGEDFNKASTGAKAVKTGAKEDKPCEPYTEEEEVKEVPKPKKAKKEKYPELDQFGFDFG
jgi:hypothetical protein